VTFWQRILGKYPVASAAEIDAAVASARARSAPARVVRPAVPSSATSNYGWAGQKWPGGTAYPGVSPALNHDLLRIAARKAYHQSLEARAVIERHTDTVVDVGLRLAPAPDSDILGIAPEVLERWAAYVGASFDRWAAGRKSIRQEHMNFYQAQRLAALSQQRDGEYFVRFHYDPRRDLLNPLQLGFLDPAQIGGAAFTYSATANTFFGDGIERDEEGREIAYNVYNYRKDGKIENIRIPAFGERSRRRLMIHGYQPEYVGQGRGYSRLSHALQEFENITDFKSSEIKKAI
jgi:capsid protein